MLLNFKTLNRIANEQLRVHDKMQREFINIDDTYSLPTPTQAILGYSKLIQRHPEKREGMLEAIARNATRLQRLTNEVDDLNSSIMCFAPRVGGYRSGLLRNIQFSYPASILLCEIEMVITLSARSFMMKTIGIVSVIASVIIVMIIISTGSGPFLFMMAIAYGQQSSTNGSAIVGSTAPKKSLPVLLIHGYLSDAAVWNKWQDLLKKDGMPTFPITFQQSDDKCGS
ncbi:MAG: hypothetical protein M3044_14565, partial [Thermoproteota archaeon]|nr:hypothetical protein [Thermoproteota archaeon]